MHYIVFDLEFNHEVSSIKPLQEKPPCPFEVIQIGAIKLDTNFNTVASYNRYVRPTIYSQINPFITDLTGITMDQLLPEATFPEVFSDYIEFIGEGDSVFCVWGMSDMKELFRNVDFHKLDKTRLSELFIDLQPYVSTHFGVSKTKLFNLQAAVEALHIFMPYNFHSALHDAFYTAEIFKKINNPTIKPKRYNPNYVKRRPIRPKKTIDFEKLIQQFEKMYARELTDEEKAMIILAYKMGKTNQFKKVL